MRKINQSIVVVALCILTATCVQKSADLVLLNASVIDVRTGEIIVQNIVINEGKINEITAEDRKGEEQIDLTGKFIIPGLWDMHAHIHKNPYEFISKLVNHGVLGIRELGTLDETKIDSLITFKKRADAHESFVPQMEYAGFIHNGIDCEVPQHKTIQSVKDIKEAVAYLKSIKASIFKIHNCFPAELLKPLGEICEREGLKIVGHIPHGLDPLKDISNSGMSSIEHVSVLMRGLSFRNANPADGIPGAAQILDGEYLDSLAVNMVKNSIAFTPNLGSEELFMKSLSEQQKPMADALMKRYFQYTMRMADHGVMILAGSDLGLDGLEPGESLHRELELLVDAGLTPLKALQSATLNPALYFNRNASLDLIAAGQIANLVILNSNPLDNISNVRDIDAIISSGAFK